MNFIKSIIRNLLRRIYLLYFRLQGVDCDKTANIRGRVFVSKSKGGYIHIGDYVTINSGTRYNSIGFQNKCTFSTIGNGSIRIGNHVGISNTSIVSQNSVVIEDRVMIGGGVKIYDTDFHSLKYENRISDRDTDIKTAPVLIKEGAFIGAGSIILKGVVVGSKSIVGAGSVVTKDIPDGEIWAGNPAKFIREI